MKHFHKWTAWALVPLFLILSACAGNAARQNVLLPAIRTSWQSIRVDATNEATAQQHPTGLPAIAAADAAIDAGDKILVAGVDWQTIERLTEGDVVRRHSAGLIGPGVAVSLRERATKFFESIRSYVQAK